MYDDPLANAAALHSRLLAGHPAYAVAESFSGRIRGASTVSRRAAMQAAARHNGYVDVFEDGRCTGSINSVACAEAFPA